jgi:molecular chaperone DnaJ
MGNAGSFSGGGMSMDDIFSHFGDIFGDMSGFSFSSRFGGGGGGRQQSQRMSRGSNLRVKVRLTLQEIAAGTEKKLKLKKYVSCKACNGTGAEGQQGYTSCHVCNGTGQTTRIANTILGRMQTTSVCTNCGGAGKTITKKCTTCYGEGIVQDEELVTVKIPAGVAEGMQLTVSGKGNAARRGGINGDLIVLIEEEPHAELIRDGNDLIYPLFVSIPDATIGTTVEIPTVDGKVKIKIEPGTQPGKILRLRGKGIPELNGYGNGDLLVTVNVWIPRSISKEERTILEKLGTSNNFQPHPTQEDKSFFQRVRNLFE